MTSFSRAARPTVPGNLAWALGVMPESHSRPSLPRFPQRMPLSLNGVWTQSFHALIVFPGFARLPSRDLVPNVPLLSTDWGIPSPSVSSYLTVSCHALVNPHSTFASTSNLSFVPRFGKKTARHLQVSTSRRQQLARMPLKHGRQCRHVRLRSFGNDGICLRTGGPGESFALLSPSHSQGVNNQWCTGAKRQRSGSGLWEEWDLNLDLSPLRPFLSSANRGKYGNGL